MWGKRIRGIKILRKACTAKLKYSSYLFINRGHLEFDLRMTQWYETKSVLNKIGAEIEQFERGYLLKRFL